MTAALQSPLRAITPPDGISIVSTVPSGASEGVRVVILFAGAQPDRKYDEVVFTPITGAPKSAPGTSVILDSSKGLRQINVKVPTGLAVGRGTVQVRDSKTNEKSAPVHFEIVSAAAAPLESMSRQTARTIRIVGSANAKFVAGKMSFFPDAGVKVRASNVISATELLLSVEVTADAPLGPKLVLIAAPDQSIFVTALIVVADTNRNPVANANGPYAALTAQPITFNSSGTSDPDGDALQLSWDFGDGSTGTGAAPVHSYAAPGTFVVTLAVADGRGGTASATSAVTITSPISLTALSVSPPALRFSEANATATLLVTGHYSDNSQRDLTASATGTTYVISAPQVSTVSTEGLVTSSANGSASITVANSGITKDVPVVVEIGVTMEALELTPPIITMRELASTAQVTLRGRFSDGSVRDLTADPGTTYSLDPAIATVSAGGLLQATAAGDGVLTARNGALSATSQVRVIVTDGAGFLRGEVYDDGRSLPLDGARVTPLIAGGVPVSSPQAIDADDRGRFTVGAAAGAALVRVEKDGYTSVDRRSTLANGAIDTLLDARLTRVDPRVNQLQSVFGGEATSADNSVAITIPAGSLDQDAALRVTPISAQGLQGLLPAGWSPIAAVDLQPADRSFAQGAALRVPHVDLFGAGAPVAVARYDAGLHQWVVQAAGVVSGDRRTIAAPIVAAGQYAFVVPDDAPLIPPAAQPGEVLAGVSPVIVPESSSATGSVVPRTAPPGEAARAVGTVILQPPGPLSSGAVLRARVTEQFDLLDSSRITPQPFVQDVVLYARPRLGDAGTLAARLPITPSLQFTIQQLSLGTVRLDVTITESSAASSIIGSTGGSVADANGNVLTLAAGSIGAEIAVGLLSLTESGLSVAVPAGMTLLGAVFVDAPGASFSVPAALSIARPAGVDDAAQVIVAQVITDNSGGRRFKIAGLGLMSPTRIAIQTTLASLVFDGVRSGGEFVFLRPSLPLGFLSGVVTSVGNPQSLALVTADSAPFAFLTSSTGAFIVAGRAGVQTVLTAVDPTGAAATGNATLNAANAIAVVNLALSHTSAIVTGTIPAANAVNVALDSSIVIDFSKAIDPATISPASVVLRAGAADVAVARVLSANRRRLTITPAAPLLGVTNYSLSLTADVRDAAGIALTPFGPQAFTTLDPSKNTALALGLIVAELPDEDGLSLITGGPGASDPASAVVATNLRTQETVTMVSAADGSFRFRLAVIVGDEISITLRDANGRETSIAITQLTSADGTTSIGTTGGTVQGPGGRLGRVLPRALSSAGLFQLTGSDAVPAALPGSFAVVDRLSLRVSDATFKRLDTVTLTESQSRFAPVGIFSAPFAAAGSLTIPADFLLTASLRFTAEAVDRDGARHSANAATVVVTGSPDTSLAETAFGDSFPTVFLTAPRQAIPLQVVEVAAVSPAARVELDLPTASATPAGHSVLLTRLMSMNGESKLSFVDRLISVDVSGQARLRTSGRTLPGATATGDYAAVSGPVAFVSGRVNGPMAIVTVDGLPFVFETDGANGSFTVPVIADAPFTLRFVNAASGAALGTANGQAPASGAAVDVGRQLSAAATVLTVSALPDANFTADISAPIVFTFSEAIDPSTVTNSAFVVTDPAGVRVFGRLIVGDRSVTFLPLRRWKFGTRYRYGVGAVVAASGARLPQNFSGEFTTFAPVVSGSAALGSANDIAVSAAQAIVGTSTGARTVNVSSPVLPQPQASLSLPGGGRAVALLPPHAVIDRNGQPVAVPTAVVTSGDAASGARLQLFDITAPATPILIGSTQVTASGAPADIVVTGDGRALVAVEGNGVIAVQLGQTVPNDPANSSHGIGARYPAAGAESVSGVALLPDRVVITGAGGITILDPVTLARRSGLVVVGGLRDIAVVGAFPFDANGDLATSQDDTFDLGVATGGADGTVQLYRIPAAGDPVLLSAVRLDGESAGVVASATERLAYVARGSRGLGIVDLDGPASIQPLDTDRDGADDRVLGGIDTAGNARKIALALERGVAFVADGSAGIAAIQLLPPRTSFLSLVRDPMAGRPGDEQDITAARVALTTDAAVIATLTAAIPAQSSVQLSIHESPAGTHLRFANGSTTAALQNGLNTLTMLVDGAASSGSDITLRVTAANGSQIAALTFRLEPFTLTTTNDIIALRVSPSLFAMPIGVSEQQLAVAAQMADGRFINVTRGAGVSYSSFDRSVAVVDDDGVVTAVAGGTASILVTLGRQMVTVKATVQHLAALTGFQVSRPRVMLTSAGQSVLVDAVARFSDGARENDLAEAGVTFESNDPQVATVDPNGRITAIAEGVATITMRFGSIASEVQVAVEFRITPNIATLEATPFGGPGKTDSNGVAVRAVITGTGSLEGVPVRFEVVGQPIAPVTVETGYSGVAIAAFRLALPGTYTVRATVTNPTGGAELTALTSIVVETASADLEPNDTPATAARTARDKAIRGSIGAGDAADLARADNSVGGTLQVSIKLAPGSNPGDVRVVLRTFDGQELSRRTLSRMSETIVQPVAAGTTLIALESVTGAAVNYSVSNRIEQAPVTVTAVTPLSGGPGTVVTIAGTGFSLDPADTYAYFGGAMARITSVSPTEIVAVVPAFAADGPVEVVSLARRGAGPAFTVGTAVIAPPTLISGTPEFRAHPVTGVTIDVKRVIVFADPVASQTDIETLATSVGAVIVGRIPSLNSYTLEVAGNRSLAAIQRLARQLETSPLIRWVNTNRVYDNEQSVDLRDANNVAPQAVAYAQARIIDAVRAIRLTPPYNGSGVTFAPTRVGILDSGFDPLLLPEVQFNGANIVELIGLDNNNLGFTWGPIANHDKVATGHGTQITSIIGALNNGAGMSGGLNGLLQPDETPFPIVVYRRGPTSDSDYNALAHMAGEDLDVLNLSFGGFDERDDYPRVFNAFRAAFALFAGRTTIVTSGGNTGYVGTTHTPSSLAMTLPYQISVGAVAVANLDGSGESADARAIFNRTGVRLPLGVIRCVGNLPPPTSESNCGDSITLAAPGEDVLALGTVQSGTPYDAFLGTSAAAPLVTATIALMQAIRGAGVDPLTPDRIRDLLVQSADDITASWNTLNEPMRRLNALNAVSSLLPPASPQMIYVADQNAENGGTPSGRLVGIDVDPLTGANDGAAPGVVIPLSFTRTGVSFVGTSPTSVAMSPTGQTLYAVVDSVSPALGHGVLVVNTISNRAENFIPFSGGGAAPVSIATLRPALAVSKDGRLIYAATSAGIVIINAVEQKVVREFTDLPAPYPALTGLQTDRLRDRLAVVRGVIQDGVFNMRGSVSALTLSEDGRMLYVAISTGGGGGVQPGGLLAINVDLYTDGDSNVRGLQSSLNDYFKPTATHASATLGDEPQAVAATGDFAYLIHGGVNQFLVANALVLPEAGILDVEPPVDPSVTVLNARGLTTVFSAAAPATPPITVSEYTGGVMFGWGPSGDSGGSVTNQNRFSTVYAGRPFGIAVHPISGRRAIVPYFQTGNFGILDMSAQTQMGSVASAHRPLQLAALSPDQFHAVVGVTEALHLDNVLWPKRGAFSAGELGARMPSPDENLLYPWAIEYAQNGRFAVASHAGVGAPRPVTTPVPNFTLDIDARFGLADLGFRFNDDFTTAANPAGMSITAGQGTITLPRFGGAISVINNDAITTDLIAHASTEVAGANGQPRPYYSMVPVCMNATITPATPSSPGLGRCATPVVQSQTEYTTTAGVSKLHRPRGITIQPFVSIEEPRFSDHVTANQAFKVAWRDQRIDEIRYTLADLTTNGAPMTQNIPFDSVETDRRWLSMEFGSLFLSSSPPVQGHRYQVTFQVRAGQQDFSMTSIQVVFDDPVEPINIIGNPLRLFPALVPLASPGTRTLEVMQHLNGGDVNVVAQSTFHWLGGSSDSNGSALSINPAGPIEAIRQALVATTGSAVPFGQAQITVSANGSIVATAPGLELVEARVGDLASDLSVVLVGFSLSDMDLTSQTAGNTWSTQLQNALGSSNSPMVLSPSGSTFIAQTGQVLLNDAILTFGNGRIHLSQLIDAVRPFIELRFANAIGGAPAPIGATPTRLHAKAVNRLQLGFLDPPLPLNLDLQATAAVAVGDLQPFTGVVTASTAGLGIVHGTLDLGGFGTAVDGLLSWVLSPLESVAIDPALLAIRTSDPPSPGPTVISTAKTTPLSSGAIAPPAGFADVAQFLARTLPFGTGPLNLAIATDPPSTITGEVATSAGGVELSAFQLTFPAPNDRAPSATTTYTIADTTVAQLGDVEPTRQHIVHQQVRGVTPLQSTVAISGLGSATGDALIVVSDCPGAVLIGQLLTTAPVINGGDPLAYSITMTNPTSNTLNNVVITVEQRIDGLLIGSTTIAVGSLATGETFETTFNTIAPITGGQFAVTLSSPGACTIQPPVVTVIGLGGLLITEMVLNPQQDWNDSGGGNGNPFDSIPGDGTIDANDIWIELSGGITGTESWTLCVTDASGATECKFLGPAVSTSQTRLRTGWGALTLPIVRVDVTDNFGIRRQHLDITAIETALGPATGVADESLTWSVHGSPTPVLMQFLRRVATINHFSPF